MHLSLFAGLQDRALGAEASDARRLDEYGFTRAARPMHDPLKLVPVINRYRKDIVVTANCGIRIPKNLTQLGVAKKPLDLILHTLVNLGQLLTHECQLATSHIEYLAPGIDAPGYRLCHRSQIFDWR